MTNKNLRSKFKFSILALVMLHIILIQTIYVHAIGVFTLAEFLSYLSVMILCIDMMWIGLIILIRIKYTCTNPRI
jgi:hypothetical protein